MVKLIVASLVLLGTTARADLYDDVERLIRNGQYDRASQLSDTRLRQAPTDPQMRLLRSRILDAQGQADEATALLESLTLEFPELPEPHNNLAVLYARQGRTQEALESLNKALRARPDYTVALENLGDLHLGLALQAYQRASGAPTAPASITRKASAIAPLLQR
jgi:Flp pilus assembly protein TadD